MTHSQPRRAPRLPCFAGLGVVLVCALLASPALSKDERTPSTKSKASAETWYVSTVISGDSAYRITHYWSKGSDMRAETMIGIHPVVTIVRGDRYWVYDELLKQGIEIMRSPRAVAEDAERNRPFGNDLDDLVRANGERVETTEISGTPLEVWRVTDGAGRRTVWVTTEAPRVPVRVENFDRQSGATATLSYAGWATAFDLPDTAFEPPGDLILQKIGYADYVEKSATEMVGPAPVLFPFLLHGSNPR